MACQKCKYRGYIVETYLVNDKEHRLVKICPECKDADAYSKYIKQTYGVEANEDPEEDLYKIIDIAEYFKRKKKV